jgi:hypothetical protein
MDDRCTICGAPGPFGFAWGGFLMRTCLEHRGIGDTRLEEVKQGKAPPPNADPRQGALL